MRQWLSWGVASGMLSRWVLGLVLATLLALAWHSRAPDRSLVINADSAFGMRTVDDRASGGKSRATLKRGNGSLVLECNIEAAYQWPYCEIAVDLGAAPQGMDLSQYDTVKLWLRAEGPEPQQQVRFFLRHFNPAYSKVGDDGSLKPMELVYEPAANPQPLEAKLQHFSVASWWNSAHAAVPLKYAGLELTNVVALDISTGGNVQPGLHRIIVERIEFGGPLVTAAQFRLYIIGVWLAAALAFVAMDALRRHRRRHARAPLPPPEPVRPGVPTLKLQEQPFALTAGVDALTGMFNRPGLERELQLLAQRSGAGLFPLALVLFDIDNFKQINDEFGGDVGDQVMRDTAALLRAELGAGQLAGRWGGGEFLLICPHTSADQALALAEHLRLKMTQASWAHGQMVTGSSGVAVAQAGDSVAHAVKRAVDAMYKAKIEGRDRVVLEVVASRRR